MADDYLPSEVVESLNLPDDEWWVWVHLGLPVKKRFGVLGQLWAFIARDDFMHILKAENLSKLTFKELRYFRAPPLGTPLMDFTYDEASPEEVTTRLWALSSEVILPTCLLPRQHSWGPFLAPDEKGGNWDDAGHRPPELVFRRAAFLEKGPFDVAVTREWMGRRKPYYHPELIVSQKFRSVLAKHRIKGVSYTPVPLVD